PADAPIGTDIREYLDLDDVILTLKMTPNRGDCLSMIGVARDLAAVTGVALKLPAIEPLAANSSEQRAVSIDATKACGHYLGRVISGINAKATTPEWMKRRLERAGFRSISPLVDITNYLTLERGRPMHAFDQDKLSGGINVRYPKAGEEMNLLNEQHVVLAPDMLLITDEAGPVAIGGVMGGLESSVTDSTTSIFFEAAYFDPDAVQGKTRVLGINSDAAYRFERGVDPQSARDGLELATRLAVEICGTSETKVGPVTEAKGELPIRKPVNVRPARVCALIGMPIETGAMTDILGRLNCQVAESGGVLQVTAPSYRFDLNLEEDFAEEIARIHGYENVPATPPTATVPITPIPDAARTRSSLRHACASLGYQEVINYSFVPEESETKLMGNTTPVRLANPIASQMSVMRTSLLGGLIQSLQHNLNRGETRAKLFEIGRCFTGADADIANQPERLAGLVYGARFPEQWGESKSERFDFFTLKGDVEHLLSFTGCDFVAAPHPALHPGRSAQIWLSDRKVGWIGEIHPRWQQEFELPAAPLAFELELGLIQTVPQVWYTPISRMQAVRRDVAVLVDDGVTIGAIAAAFNSLKLPNIVDFGLFDVYRGQNLDSGKKSLAFRIVMQDTERTLTDVECDAVVARFIEVISHKFGATLRK
ncbi:MAG: phenylalanine--tRNA ligase subunit beta, partial [Burkholderiales bacterium]